MRPPVGRPRGHGDLLQDVEHGGALMSLIGQGIPQRRLSVHSLTTIDTTAPLQLFPRAG
jgi:hypothetical protein